MEKESRRPRKCSIGGSVLGIVLESVVVVVVDVVLLVGVAGYSYNATRASVLAAPSDSI